MRKQRRTPAAFSSVLTCTILFLLLSFLPVTFSGCGGLDGEITELESNIESPGHPQQGGSDSSYDPNMDCHWWYPGDEETLVLFRMSSLQIQPGSNNDNLTCDKDYLRIELERWRDQYYCGDYISENTYRGIGRWDIWFKSDAFSEYRGFRLGYRITLGFNPCKPSDDPCGYGECYMNETTYRAACDCYEGYTGEECKTEIDECASQPCLNDGTCTDLVAEYECECTRAWEGVNCEEENEPCLPNPCQHNGDCESNYDDYTYECTCQPGYDGDNCEVEVGCGDPGIPNLEEDRRFDFDTTLEYTCVESHILKGPNQTTCVRPDDTRERIGDWSAAMPDCEVNFTWIEPDLKRREDWRISMIVMGSVGGVLLIGYSAWMNMKNPWHSQNKHNNVDHDEEGSYSEETSSYSDTSSYTTS